MRKKTNFQARKAAPSMPSIVKPTGRKNPAAKMTPGQVEAAQMAVCGLVGATVANLLMGFLGGTRRCAPPKPRLRLVEKTPSKGQR